MGSRGRNSPSGVSSLQTLFTDFENIFVRTGLLVRDAFENVCLQVRSINGLTYLRTDFDRRNDQKLKISHN